MWKVLQIDINMLRKKEKWKRREPKEIVKVKGQNSKFS